MTVSYQNEVASSTNGGFTRLLFKWRGSIYKLIYRETILFLFVFGLLSACYRNAFNDQQKQLFERLVLYCDTFSTYIPLSFILGFYVTYVASRWWQQYMALPWPDKIMHSIALYVTGNDDHGRMIRRTLMRYLNLTLILVLRSISSAVKRRFPTLDHVVESGFMTKIELEMFQSVPSGEFNTYWIPCTWFISLLKETKKCNRITDSQGLKIIMEEFNEFRSKCGLLWSYDWVSIPLVYTQVVTIATYAFFLATVVGRQFVGEKHKPYQMEIDIYIPVFTILQFLFYMGLLKVAEQLINPFGDDEEDFELNWLIDRHTKVSYLGVDILMTRAPPLVKDMYFDDVDLTLPYTQAAVAYKKKTYRGSVHDMLVPEEKQSMFLPEIVEEEDDNAFPKPPPTPKASLLNLLAGEMFLRTPRSSLQNLSAGANQNGRGDMSTLTVPEELTGRERNSSPRYKRNRSPSLFRLLSSSKGSGPQSPLEAPSGTSGIRRSPFSKISLSSPQVGMAGLDDNDDANSFMLGEGMRSSGGRRDSSFSAVYTTSLDGESTHCSEPGDIYYSTRSDLNLRCQDEPGTPRPRLKSCPKLLFLNRKTSHGKKKGVRWRAMEKRYSDPPNPNVMFNQSQLLRQLALLPGASGVRSDESVSNIGQYPYYDVSPTDYLQPHRRNLPFPQDVMGSQRSFESHRSSSPRVIPKICNDTYRLTRTDSRHSTGAVPKSHRSRGIQLPQLRGVPPTQYAAAIASPSPNITRSLPDISFQENCEESPIVERAQVIVAEPWSTASLDGEDVYMLEQAEAGLPQERIPEPAAVHKPLNEGIERQFVLPIARRQLSSPTESSESIGRVTPQEAEGRKTDNSEQNKHHSRWKDFCWP